MINTKKMQDDFQQWIFRGHKYSYFHLFHQIQHPPFDLVLETKILHVWWLNLELREVPQKFRSQVLAVKARPALAIRSDLSLLRKPFLIINFRRRWTILQKAEVKSALIVQWINHIISEQWITQVKSHLTSTFVH